MNLTAIPNQIRESGLFCCWRYEDRDGRKTKVPYNPATGTRAKSNDPASFVLYQIAAQAAGYDGIGVGIFKGLCAIDLDHCVREDGSFTETAADIIALMHSYTEFSPSGEGVHILFQAEGFKYDSKYYIMNRQKGIEVYVAGATSKYVTITGDVCAPYEFGDRTRELQAVLECFMEKPESSAGNAINAVNSDFTFDDLLRKALSSKSGAAFSALWSGSTAGYPSQSEADYALCRQLAFWTGRDAAMMDAMFRQSGLMREKWDRPQSGSTYGKITIQRAISNCTEVYKPRLLAASVQPQPVNEEPAQEFPPITPLTPQWSELPAFPVEALPNVVKTYVSAVAEHSQTAPDMAAVISLGVLAVCLQGKYMVEGSPGYYEPLSLYTVVIAAPGERKSSVMRDMTRYLYEYEQEYNQSRSAEIRKNRLERESLERQIITEKKKLEQKYDWTVEANLCHLQAQLDEKPELKPARFFADDCSSEALTSLMSNNGGTFAVISTEGGVFDLMAGRYNNKVNIDVWLKGHCGDTIYVDRKTREAESIQHPALSAILTIQPCVLEEIMSNATMAGRGLIARFLYASPPSRIGNRVFRAGAIEPEISAAYRSLVFQLMAIPAGEAPRALRLSEQAAAMMDQYFREHERYLVGEGQAISDWASKYIGAVLRIAGLLHGADMRGDQHEISSETLSRAIQIGEYFLAHSGYAYSMMGTDLSIQKAKFVMAKLKKKKITQIKRAELFQMCRGKFFKKTEEIFPTLDLLADHGYLRMEEPEHFTVGRPPDTLILVNPAA